MCIIPEEGTNLKSLHWTLVNVVSAYGTTMEEFIDETGRFCKQVWDDGYEEIFEIC